MEKTDTTETPQPEVTEKDLPALDLVYPLAMDSFRDITARIKAQDERIQRIVTLALALTAAVPASYQLFGIAPNLIILLLAGACFLVCLALCVIASVKTEMLILSAEKLFNDYLHIPEFVYKVALIKYAGEAHKENLKHVTKRYNLLLWALIFLAAEVILLVVSGLSGLL